MEGLNLRNEKERVHYALVDSYARLADRLCVVEANASELQSQTVGPLSGGSPLAIVKNETLGQMRIELAEALRANGQLLSRLKVAEESCKDLKTRIHTDSKTIKDLSIERAVLHTKVKDRNEELRGKAQLLVEVQDENMSLILQLNMAEQQFNKLKKENKDLIDRWMARIGQEADAMNDASKF